MLNKDFNQRWKISQVLCHTWVTNDGEVELINDDTQFDHPDNEDVLGAVTKIEKEEKKNFDKILE